MFKLMMSWDIRSKYENEYLEFIIREFGPGLMALGVRLTDSWYTLYGEHPQILMGAVADDLESLQRALASDEWHTLKKKLLTYVTDYSQKVIRANGLFQL